MHSWGTSPRLPSLAAWPTTGTRVITLIGWPPRWLEHPGKLFLGTEATYELTRLGDHHAPGSSPSGVGYARECGREEKAMHMRSSAISKPAPRVGSTGTCF